MDGEGRVLNRAAVEHIVPPWRGLIDEVIGIYQEALKDQLHSVWVRGSVAAGTAVEGVSDVDTLAFVREPKAEMKSLPEGMLMPQLPAEWKEKWFQGQPLKWVEPTWGQERSRQLIQKHPCARVIEFVYYSWEADWETLHPQFLPMMRTQAVRVYGMDDPLPGNQPLLGEMERFGRWIEEDWQEFLKYQDNTRYLRIFIKTFIRGAYEQFMAREGKYATDFYPCIEGVCKYHPEWRPALEEMVAIYTDPEGKGSRLADIARDMVDAVLRLYTQRSITD